MLLEVFLPIWAIFEDPRPSLPSMNTCCGDALMKSLLCSRSLFYGASSCSCFLFGFQPSQPPLHPHPLFEFVRSGTSCLMGPTVKEWLLVCWWSDVLFYYLDLSYLHGIPPSLSFLSLFRLGRDGRDSVAPGIWMCVPLVTWVVNFTNTWRPLTDSYRFLLGWDCTGLGGCCKLRCPSQVDDLKQQQQQQRIKKPRINLEIYRRTVLCSFALSHYNNHFLTISIYISIHANKFLKNMLWSTLEPWWTCI